MLYFILMQKTYSRKHKLEPIHSDGKYPTPTKSLVDDEEEKKHFRRVVNSFRCYRSHLSNKIFSTLDLLEQLPDRQKEFLKDYKESLIEFEKCVQHNQSLINLIIKDVEHMFHNAAPADASIRDEQPPSLMDIEKVQTTLKQFVRDWSKEGAVERESCYQPVLDEIVSHFPPDLCPAGDIKVLVPGAGLGRLAFEIARRGFTCQGNEFSLFMLIASNFVLNKCNAEEVFSFYPWIHQVDNNLKAEDQMEVIRFPDVNPSITLKAGSNFTMTAGDFLEVYNNSEEWDCVATCFFIDCANNIVDFIEKIYDILKPGGIWVNLGPLLYHFSNMPGEFSIEPPYTIVKDIILKVGFQMEKEETGKQTKYVQNPNSMLQYQYNSVFFVCKKPST